jgi:hypothetical protein
MPIAGSSAGAPPMGMPPTPPPPASTSLVAAVSMGSLGGMGGMNMGGVGDDGGGVCFDFTKGRCMRGDGCRFSHDLALASSALAASKGGVCFDFTKGVCNRGDTCRFSHELPAAGTQVKSSGVCFDFTRGMCTRGDSCRFSHDMNAVGDHRATPLSLTPHLSCSCSQHACGIVARILSQLIVYKPCLTQLNHVRNRAPLQGA